MPAEAIRPTEFSTALDLLATAVLGSPEAGPDLDVLLATVDWLRKPEHRRLARILIGDLTSGY